MRLTEWINDDEPFAIMIQNDLKIGHKTCINKLAAYEDTGLEPEEVADIAAREENVEECIDRMEERMERIKVENIQLKELLKKAVNDFRILVGACPTDIDCVDCPLYNSKLDECAEGWRYADEAEEVLKRGETSV